MYLCTRSPLCSTSSKNRTSPSTSALRRGVLHSFASLLIPNTTSPPFASTHRSSGDMFTSTASLIVTFALGASALVVIISHLPRRPCSTTFPSCSLAPANAYTSYSTSYLQNHSVMVVTTLSVVLPPPNTPEYSRTYLVSLSCSRLVSRSNSHRSSALNRSVTARSSAHSASTRSVLPFSPSTSSTFTNAASDTPPSVSASSYLLPYACGTSCKDTREERKTSF